MVLGGYVTLARGTQHVDVTSGSLTFSFLVRRKSNVYYRSEPIVIKFGITLWLISQCVAAPSLSSTQPGRSAEIKRLVECMVQRKGARDRYLKGRITIRRENVRV